MIPSEMLRASHRNGHGAAAAGNVAGDHLGHALQAMDTAVGGGQLYGVFAEQAFAGGWRRERPGQRGCGRLGGKQRFPGRCSRIPAGGFDGRRAQGFATWCVGVRLGNG